MTSHLLRAIAAAHEARNEDAYTDSWEKLITALRAGEELERTVLPRDIYIYRRGRIETWHLQAYSTNYRKSDLDGAFEVQSNSFEVVEYLWDMRKKTYREEWD